MKVIPTPICMINHIAETTEVIFEDKVRNRVNNMQSAGYAVEIQYQSAVVMDEVPTIVYSALIIGRRKY